MKSNSGEGSTYKNQGYKFCETSNCTTKYVDQNGQTKSQEGQQYSAIDNMFLKESINGNENNYLDHIPENARMLKPLVQEKIIEIMKPEIEEKIIEVPQIQYVEKLVEVPHVILQEKLIHVPKPVIHERIKKCPKTIFQEKIVEVPQIKVVDKIIEVPQYVYQEKIIQVPKVMVQERIIPVPKKVIKEKIVEIPQIELKNINVEKIEEVPEYIPEVVKRDVPYTQIIDRPFHVEKIVEVPHVQHIYRNIVSPQYRHIPKPVEVPMAHYRTFPVEKLVDRNVPVPVEIQIIQEFLCPKIEARYKEIPVPVHVQRIIEHPIPKDAMNNPLLLPLYYQEDNFNASKSGTKNGSNTIQNNKSCFMFNWNKNNNQKSLKGRSNSVELLLHNDSKNNEFFNINEANINPNINFKNSINQFSGNTFRDINSMPMDTNIMNMHSLGPCHSINPIGNSNNQYNFINNPVPMNYSSPNFNSEIPYDTNASLKISNSMNYPMANISLTKPYPVVSPIVPPVLNE
ncbi:hypothetical protein YYG_03879 [Plasmodium vinckei petteri]|uniref:Inner membrane complex protein 1e (IMC1e) n=2 Tax=Plasmodium TaxID=5820 RepID=A0A1A8WDJ2_PLAOA|nr:hypothetical protein YYG_03879 [Plasmodium vinckei petteri]CAD2097443.1 inner membrane complex protein 1e, putative [Plasmodium vinckei petteri]SBS89277.1 inner membrane complex protein 1e (IMC1e) [Plasmodium ovale curtisi]